MKKQVKIKIKRLIQTEFWVDEELYAGTDPLEVKIKRTETKNVKDDPDYFYYPFTVKNLKDDVEVTILDRRGE